MGRGKVTDSRKGGPPSRTGASLPPAPEFKPGNTLSPTELDRFEPSLGFDFSRVRIHDGSDGAEVTRPLGAAAVTQGQDVYLSPAAPARGTPGGDRLLGHELVHTA